jgi:hypothetical protein
VLQSTPDVRKGSADMPASTRLVLGCIALVALAPAFAQTVYTWKDAKGVTHYSDAPPPKGTQSRQVQPQPAPPTPTPVATTPAKTVPASPSTNAAIAAAIDPAAVAAREKQRAESCKQAQENLAILKNSYGVAVDNDGDGKNDAVLDTAQRQKETENMQLAVQANCDG